MLTLLFQDPAPEQAGADFGGSTQIHPLGVAALGLLSALAVLLPRRWSALPVILLLCFIPAGQRLVIATVDFTFIRLLMLVIWFRLFIRRELRPIVWNHLDRTMLVWAFVSVLTGFLLGWTLSILINRLGIAVDALMIYFFFRMLIRNHEDLASIARQFLVSSFAVAMFFLVENRTQQNLFAMFGGVPAFTDIRDGRLRCQGAFAHAILAGCFWACLIPFYAISGFLGRGWLLPGAGTLAAVAIIGMCASSTPVMAFAFGLVGAAAFLIRGSLRWMRWLILLWLAVLHFLIMKQPVWHLLARIDVVGGSTGWHRFHLVDKFFAYFHEWWQVGTLRTGHWGPGLHDVTNQYVAEGVAGGIWRLALFALMILLAFTGISRSMRLQAAGRVYWLCTWALGTALFMHCMNFIAVSYFEQIVVQWHMLLAAIGSLTLVPGASPTRQLAQLRA
ncbi:MAG: hypothetical protein KAI24_22650 [Planctomycetes bacterium]|nr:hypothetical protein [Planctomycetota bacterium]